ncbi:MAG: hypothetical protein IT303_09000 [Dehalococcoidia bacterium]|nr:hypothetical protein [Dehalococcoidia bacterium]
MTHWKRFSWLLLVPALAAMLLVACGGGDDDDDSDSDSKSSSSSSKDDDADEKKSTSSSKDDDEDDKKSTSSSKDEEDEDEESTSSSNATSADKKYVSQICSALIQFEEELFEAVMEVDAEDEAAAAKALAEPMDKLVQAWEDADPPKDLKKYHEQAVDQAKDAVAKLKKGDMNAFEEMGDLPAADKDIEDRLNAAASEDEDCIAAGMIF